MAVSLTSFSNLLINVKLFFNNTYSKNILDSAGWFIIFLFNISEIHFILSYIICWTTVHVYVLIVVSNHQVCVTHALIFTWCAVLTNVVLTSELVKQAAFAAVSLFTIHSWFILWYHTTLSGSLLNCRLHHTLLIWVFTMSCCSVVSDK